MLLKTLQNIIRWIESCFSLYIFCFMLYNITNRLERWIVHHHIRFPDHWKRFLAVYVTTAVLLGSATSAPISNPGDNEVKSYRHFWNNGTFKDVEAKPGSHDGHVHRHFSNDGSFKDVIIQPERTTTTTTTTPRPFPNYIPSDFDTTPKTPFRIEDFPNEAPNWSRIRPWNASKDWTPADGSHHMVDLHETANQRHRKMKERKDIKARIALAKSKTEEELYRFQHQQKKQSEADPSWFNSLSSAEQNTWERRNRRPNPTPAQHRLHREAYQRNLTMPFNAMSDSQPILEESADNIYEFNTEHLTMKDHIFDAYDCRRPTNTEQVSRFAPDDPCIFNTTAQFTRNGTFMLAQEERHRRFPAKRCFITRFIHASYCGVFGHATPHHETDQDFLPRLTTANECREMHKTMKFKDTNDNLHEISMGLTQVNFFTKGRTYANGNQIDCEGENHRVDGQILPSMVVIEKYKITLEVVKMASNKGHVVDQSNDLIIHNTYDYGSAEEAVVGAYFWDVSHNYCTLAINIPRFEAAVTEDPGNRTILMSYPPHLVRLQLLNKVNKCGNKVYKTSDSSLFVIEINSEDYAKPLDRLIAKAEISMTTFVSNRDQFLYAHVTRSMTKTFNTVLKRECEMIKKRISERLNNGLVKDGFSTYKVRGNQFGADAGETAWLFDCMKIQVKAFSHTKCFLGLPVHVPSHLNAVAEPEVMFLEPLTRRLSRFGLEVPCHPLFKVQFRNINGNWIQAAPALIEVKSPKDPQSTFAAFDPLDFQFEEFPTGNSGIYDAGTMLGWENYLEFNRAKEAMQYSFHRQMQGWEEGSPVRINNLFPSFHPDDLEPTIWTNFKDFLSTYGQAASIVVMTILIVHGIVALCSFVFRLKNVADIYGLTTRTIAGACFPMIHLFKKEKKRKRTNNAYDRLHRSTTTTATDKITEEEEDENNVYEDPAIASERTGARPKRHHRNRPIQRPSAPPQRRTRRPSQEEYVDEEDDEFSGHSTPRTRPKVTGYRHRSGTLAKLARLLKKTQEPISTQQMRMQLLLQQQEQQEQQQQLLNAALQEAQMTSNLNDTQNKIEEAQQKAADTRTLIEEQRATAALLIQHSEESATTISELESATEREDPPLPTIIIQRAAPARPVPGRPPPPPPPMPAAQLQQQQQLLQQDPPIPGQYPNLGGFDPQNADYVGMRPRENVQTTSTAADPNNHPR